jgi:D-amino-acid oxidase
MPFHIDPEDKVQQWSTTCFKILQTQAPLACGVEMHTGYIFFKTRVPDPLPWYSELTNMSVVTPAEDPRVPSQYAAALRFTAPIVAMEKYLSWLHARDTLKANIVVNCTGVGARTFVDDTGVTGGRGVLLFGERTSAQESFDFFFSEAEDDGYNLPGTGLAYAFPRGNGLITMGGSLNDADGRLTADDDEIAGIRRRVGAIVPCLEGVREVRRWAGLRPLRQNGVRLEIETHPARKISVVHCYGHGGGGLTTCWGCADEVVRLVHELA